MKKKLTIGIILIGFAFLISFVFVPFFVANEKKAVSAYFANTTILSGETIKPENVVAKKVYLKNMPKDLVLSKDVIGKTVAHTVFAGDLIRRNNIRDKKSDAFFTIDSLNGRNGVISVSFKELADCLDGDIKTGDIISIISVENKMIVPELKYVYVFTGAHELSAERNDMNIKLLVSSKQAEAITRAEKSGGIKAVLVYRGDMNTANKFLDKQNKFLLK